jgi:hypothetical protein
VIAKSGPSKRNGTGLPGDRRISMTHSPCPGTLDRSSSKAVEFCETDCIEMTFGVKESGMIAKNVPSI